MTGEIVLGKNLELPKCPLCKVDKPNLSYKYAFDTKNHLGSDRRFWKIYICSRCGGVVSAHSGSTSNGKMKEFFPKLNTVNNSIPEKAANFLKQAHDSLHAPSGCIMLCASAVDEMLKQRSYKEGTLYKRIKSAAEDGVLTSEMETWAHEIRLDANDERHSDENAGMPSHKDAKRTLDFTDALAEYLFVLPGRVRRGIKADD